MTFGDFVIEQFRKEDRGIKVKVLSEDEARIYEEMARKRYDELKHADKNGLFHLFDRFGRSTSGGYDPRVWLIDFLVGRKNIVAIPTRHYTTGREMPSYWFSTGEDAYQGMQGLAGNGLERYDLLDNEDSFFINYDYIGNTLFMMGEELIKWANTLRNQFYTVIGLSEEYYDFHLSDARVENWGRRLILDCIYKPKDYPIDRSQRMMIIFNECSKIAFGNTSRLFAPAIHPKLWMWMGYKPQDAEAMTIPAHLSNLSVDIKFTYESITVIKDKNYFPPPDIFAGGK